MEGEKRKERLFLVMKNIDQRVATIKKKAIILVGLSRVGKSTAFNWIYGHPLTARKVLIERREANKSAVVSNNPEPTGVVRRRGQAPVAAEKPTVTMQQTSKVTYVAEDIKTEAEIRSGFVSCTLEPNIVDFTMLGEGISLVDMAGYGDTRDYVGTLGVSYSLKAVLEEVEEVRFIIVIEQNALESYTGVCSTFGHFLNMFNFKLMGEQFKRKVFSATSLLVTQSLNGTKHRQKLDYCINQLNNPKIQTIPNKDLIIELLDDIHYEDRIAEFKLARIGFPPEPCEIIETFEKADPKDPSKRIWPYLRVGGEEGSKMVSLPFEKEFKELKKEEQDKFTRGIKARLLSYKSFSQIFAQLIWEQLKPGRIHDIQIGYRQFFERVDRFIEENDHYETGRDIVEEHLLLPEFTKPQKVHLLRLLLQVKDVVTFEEEQLSRHSSQIKGTMGIFRERIEQLMRIFTTVFCRNRRDYRRMLQAKYILERGTREFYMLIRVAEEYVNNSTTTIRDHLEGMFNENIAVIVGNFLHSFTLPPEERVGLDRNPHNVLEQYLSSRESVYALDSFFEVYSPEFMLLGEEEREVFLQLRRDVKMIHGRHEFANGNYRQAVEYLLEALSFEEKYESSCRRRSAELSEPDQRHLEEILFANQENIFHMVQAGLVRLGKLQIARDLSVNFRWVDSVCEISELIVNDGRVPQGERLEAMQQYATYCLEHGRQEKGMVLLQKLLEAQRSNRAEKGRVLALIKENLKYQAENRKKYEDFLEECESAPFHQYNTREIVSRIHDSLFAASKADESKIIRILQPALATEPQDEIELLKKYLEDRENSSAAENGFGVKYISHFQKIDHYNNKKARCIEEIIINNKGQLKEDLTPKLLKRLEAISSSPLKNDEEIYIKVSIDRITLHSEGDEISEKTVAIFPKRQAIKPTFEYSMKTMKKIKRIVKEPLNKLTELIRKARSDLENLTNELKAEIQLIYSRSIRQNQTDALIALVYREGNTENEELKRRIRQLNPDTGLVSHQFEAIFNLIRLKLKRLSNECAEEENKIIERSLLEHSAMND